MPIVGVEKLYIAPLTLDSATDLTFEIPVYYPGIKEIGVKPKQNTERLYAENILWDQATSFDSADVDVTQADLTSAQRATLLGQTIATLGGVYAKSTDVAPYVAVLYKANLSGGGFRYGVLYKGIFNLPDDSMKGQEGKKDFQVPKLSAIFQPTKFNGMWEYHVDTTDANCPATIDSTWFTAVAIPDADTIPPTVITTPADAATAVAVTANMVWTFNEAIDVLKVTAANFFLMKSTDGTLVSGSLAITGANKIVTLDPTASLAAATPYIAICTTNVTDVAGNRLATTNITNFTTA